MRFPQLLQEIGLSFTRSSGPGGQNVNKTNTKVVLRWNPDRSGFLPKDVKTRFIEKNSGRIVAGGDLVISVETHRSQKQNLEEVIRRVEDLIELSWDPPKKRVKTRPTRAARETRLKTKKIQSMRKKHRSGADT